MDGSETDDLLRPYGFNRASLLAHFGGDAAAVSEMLYEIRKRKATTERPNEELRTPPVESPAEQARDDQADVLVESPAEQTVTLMEPPTEPSTKPSAAKKAKPKTNRGGRPAKWNTDTAFALGMAMQGRYTTPAEAARKAGIGKSTLLRWLRQGQAGDPRFAPLVARMAAIRQDWLSWL